MTFYAVRKACCDEERQRFVRRVVLQYLVEHDKLALEKDEDVRKIFDNYKPGRVKAEVLMYEAMMDEFLAAPRP